MGVHGWLDGPFNQATTISIFDLFFLFSPFYLFLAIRTFLYIYMYVRINIYFINFYVQT